MYKSKNFIAIPPGATIKEQLVTRGMSQKEFAQRMGMSEKHISNLINGKVEITTSMSIHLESVLGLPSSFWQRLEASYREQCQKVHDELDMEIEIELAKKIPYNNMAKLGWVTKTRKTVEKVRNLRNFFEVAKLGILDELRMPGIAYRVRGGTQDNDYALAAWAQKAKCEARKIETKKINIAKLESYLNKIRAMTLEKPEDFSSKLIKLLSECGIAVVFLPHLEGSYLHGASFYDGNRIVLGLSVRGKSADIFWFSLFHELHHIIAGHINTEGSTTADEEQEADCFARDILIPTNQYNRFIELGAFDRESICRFAYGIGVAPGILLGRLQKENIVKYSYCQDLKPKYCIVP